MKISTELFNKTSVWMKRNARPLELARWEYLFENGSKERVLQTLSAYQNEDGGFGHGIEPDFWLPLSSPMATWAAGQILVEVSADPHAPIVQSIVSYLFNTLDIETGMWQSVLPENNENPHAPWWHWKEGVQKNWMFNPSAELAAMLVHFSPESSEEAELGWGSLEKAIQRLMECTEMDRHEINSFQKMLVLLSPYKTNLHSRVNYNWNDVAEKVDQLALTSINKDASSWATGYVALPLDFIELPEDSLCDQLEGLVEQNLQFYLDQMSEEGIWDISWGWGDYPQAFPIARRYWMGILAVKRYTIFKSFGGI